MSDREPTAPRAPTQDELIRAAYERGVKEGAERADQWVSSRLGSSAGAKASAWVMSLLSGSFVKVPECNRVHGRDSHPGEWR